MRLSFKGILLLLMILFVAVFIAGYQAVAQGSSGTIQGVVKDQTGAVVPGATVEISNPVSGLQRQTVSGGAGEFRFVNVPFNPYHLVVRAGKFQPVTEDVDVRSAVPVVLDISLKIGEASTTISVEAESKDLIEVDSQPHTDVERDLFEKVPLESATSSVSALVTQTVPGIAADSNGLFHGIGDHAENAFSVDGQPITDQQSKVFSNQVPIDSIQSLEVLTGAPTAEYGGKTSLVIKVATRSGQGVTTPHGALTGAYGTFGTSSVGFNVAYGGEKWGNFITANGLNTSRFLDGPEFKVLHDRGNEENLFDRVDFQPTQNDSLHLNFGFTRSWFQNPNTFDQQLHTCSAGFTCNATGQAVNPLTAALLGATDQRSQILTYNVAPSWNHLIGSHAVFTLGAFVRKDQYNFYPSADAFADFSPALQAQTIKQDRKLTNAGVRSDVSYVKGIHNIKVGAVYQHTFLTENDQLGTVDPGFLALFNRLDASGNPIAGTSCLADPTDPTSAPVSAPCTTLAPSDLTRGGSVFNFRGHADVKETALYIQDSITKGSWAFNVGIRGDIYRGLSSGSQAEPRAGIAYNIKATNTVLRVSYARTLETPFNENLVISSTGCSLPVIAAMVPPPNSTCALGAIRPGWRNEFHAGFQQAFGKYLVVDGDYLWKYTHNGYDFGVVASTPIAFPIEWHNSKIPGYTLRVTVPNFHRFTAYVVMSSVAARFFPPQQAGVTFLPAPAVFRIDHDEHFNQTTHLQYQPWKRGPWLGFNWRYDSGLVAGAVPCFANTATCLPSTVTGPGGQQTVLFVNNLTGLPMTADQEFQGGFTCNGVPAAPSPTGPALTSCPAAAFGSKLIKIPGINKEQDDKNPQRIAPRSLFDASIGHDNLFKGDRYRWSLRLTAINLTNKVALYNYFSTFSGTHYVTPRALTAEIGFHF